MGTKPKQAPGSASKGSASAGPKPTVSFGVNANLNSGSISVGTPTVTGLSNTQPMTGIAVNITTGIQYNQRLTGKDDFQITDKLKLAAEFARRSTSFSASNSLTGTYKHQFNDFADVIVHLDPNAPAVDVGYHPGPIVSHEQLDLSFSRGLNGQVITDKGTITLKIPSKYGSFSASASTSLGPKSETEAKIGWTFGIPSP